MSRMRTGIADPGLYARGLPDLVQRNTRTLALMGGADSVWVPDHLMGILPASIWSPRHIGATRFTPSIDGYLETWTTLGYLAAQNRLARLRLGVGVTDTGRRNPAVTAQAAATLHLLSRGRGILGMGPGERENNEPYGVQWDRPVARFEEAMATIRALWSSGGTPISRDSEFFPLRKAVFDVPPYRGTRPPIWIGAHGPRMLRAAGRYADAWYPAFALRPAEYARRLDQVRTAASDAGRDPQRILPAASLFVFTGVTRDSVDEAITALPAKAFALCAPAEMWKQHGAEHPLGPDFSGIQDLMPQILDEATVQSYAQKVPPTLLREVCLVGTPSEVVEQVAAWRDRGLRYAVLTNMSHLQPDMTKGMLATVPFARILRGLRRL
ncbi:LLM class flavin-dependent oxidoreductase [Nocardia sp. CNY236]|uniref:LLM class flavin-dependent oxidoreductase n=1 Tax=Nocardia sp. CNY236 TaxID=1169152 RepID=UPI0003FF54D9